MFWKQLNLQAHLRRKLLPFPEAKTKISDIKVPEQETEAEAGSSEPTKIKSLETEEEKITKPTFVEETGVIAPEASPKFVIILFVMLQGKNCQKKKSKRPSTTPKNWNIQKGR